MSSSADFYNDLAETYDEMTRFEERFEASRSELGELVGELGIESAVDLACGTGFHTVVLTSLGVDTIGVDSSSKAIEAARRNAEKYQQYPEFIEASMQAEDWSMGRQRDAVFCLGNSIPHLLNDADLQLALTSVRRALKPGGWFIGQLLNYRRILINQERIVNISRQENNEYIRFYDFLDPLVRFNLLSITWDQNRSRQRISSTLLFPYTAEDLRLALNTCGFSQVLSYEGYSRKPFDADESKNLLIMARKGS